MAKKDKTPRAAAAIIVCAGDACVENKSKKVRANFEELIETNGLAGRLRLKKGDCAKDCKHGPIVTIEPDGKTYASVKPKDVEELFQKILKHLGLPATDLHL